MRVIEKNTQSGIEEITVSKEESFSIKKEILHEESKKKRRFARFMRFVNKYKKLISIIGIVFGRWYAEWLIESLFRLY